MWRILLTALLYIPACQNRDEPPRVITANQAGQIAVELSSLDFEPRVLNVVQEPHYYRVLIAKNNKSDESQHELFVSLDGMYLFGNAIIVEEERQKMNNDKRFAQCLLDAGVSIYVKAGEPGALRQAEELGLYSFTLSISCDANPANCLEQGINLFPTIRIKNQISADIYLVQSS